MKQNNSSNRMSWIMLGLSMSAVGLTGCQVSVGGQLLPSGYYIEDDVQYFAAGPEFKLTKEAAAMKSYNAEQAAQAAGGQ